MTFNLKKISVAVAMACLPALSAQAAIQFNNLQGVGSGPVTGFTTEAGNYIFQGIDQTKDASGCAGGIIDLGSAACVATLAPTFLYGQTVISGFKREGGGTFQATSGVNEYTIVMKVPVYTYITSAGATVTMSATFNPAGPSFFEIWAGDLDSDPHTGFGFNNGDSRILFGTATALSGLDLTSNVNTALRQLDNRAPTSVASSPPREFTQASGEPVASITNSGSTDVSFEVTGGDIAYFPTLPTSITAGFDINPFGPNLKAPFVGVAPTHSFLLIGGPVIDYDTTFGNDTITAPGTTVLNPSPTPGGAAPAGTYYVNNFNCGDAATTPCSYMVEGAGDGTFDVVSVPEPGVLALLGLGLAGIAGFSRRRRSA